MPSTIRHPLYIAAIAASLALFGACSGPSSAQPAGNAARPGSGQSAVSTSQPSPSKSAAAAKPEQSPLEQALWSHIGGAYDQDKAAAQQQQVEEATAECMSQQGFKYIPVHHSSSAAAVAADDAAVQTREWAVQNGYGLSTQHQDPVTDSPVDPNKATIDAMSPAEKRAYLTALFGSQKMGGGAAPASSGGTTSAAAQGCIGVANDKVYGKQQQLLHGEEMVALQADLDKLDSDVQADPRTTQLNSAWASCMADAGFDKYAKPEDAANDFVNRLSGFRQSQQQALANVAPGSTAAPVMPTPDPAIQDAERRTATADWDCKN